MEKETLNSDAINEWLASTGYLPPENESEYCRFKTLFPISVGFKIGINPFDILEGKPFKASNKSITMPMEKPHEYKLVATKKKPKNLSDDDNDMPKL